jgi:exodeoxyribonuclease V alpha subunit
MNGIDNFEFLSGIIENVVYHNDSNDYTVLEIVDESNSLITAVGTMAMAFEGEQVILKGSWTYHKEFGKQFAFESYEKKLPDEVDGILQYLSSSTVKGVGPVTALKIVNKFGVDTFDVIENHPEWLSDIPGITMKKAAIISDSFRQQTGIRGVMMYCKDFFATGEVTKVYKKLGAGAVGIIKEDPYILCDDDYGISFEKVDSFAMTLDIPRDSANRIFAAVKYIFSYNASMNGHTCLPKEKLICAVSSLIQITAQRIENCVSDFIMAGSLVSYKKDETVFIMTSEVAIAEKYISESLCELDEHVSRFSVSEVSSLLEKIELQYGISYANMQKKAIYEALSSGITIITGGPGTGKTTVIKALISIFKSLSFKCVLAAPTGRAAKRISEATSEEAKTVHRMLELERSDERRASFAKNERNPLEENVVIIDEASMMDIALTEALFRAMRRGSRLILIGDADQLPSVGAGNVFSDLISSGKITTVRLTEIFRQSKESLIITNAHKINSGEAPILNDTINDFFFVRRENEREIAETVAELITKRLPKTYGSSVKEQIQVISPSKKGAGGIEILNKTLQERLNPKAKFKKEKSAHGIEFREGDKVMYTANNYEVEWERGGYVGSGIFNGDIGVIESINNVSNEVSIRFDDRLVSTDFDFFENLELAYAITVHKSQGSEYPVVIMPMFKCAPMLLTRNLLYTAVTRAKRMVILVGRSDVPMLMVNNSRKDLRYTTLRERILDIYS